MDREIKFILRMVDQTRGALRSINGGLTGTARASRQTNENLRRTNENLRRTARETRQARDELGRFTQQANGRRGVGALANNFRQASVNARLLRGAITGVAAGIAGIGVLSISGAFSSAIGEARQLEEALSRVVGLTNATREQVDAARPAIREISNLTGQNQVGLAEAFFTINSAGIQGAEGLDVLRVAAEAGAAGLGETRDIAQVATVALEVFGDRVSGPAEALDQFLAVAREGNFEVSQLSNRFSQALGPGEAFGASFSEIGGAIAVVTRTTGDANQAVTQIEGLFRQLNRQAPQSIDALRTVGLTFQDVQQSLEQDGLIGTLTLLDEAFAGNQAAISRFLGDASATQAFGTLTRDLDATRQSLEAVENSAGSVSAAFNEFAQTDAGRVAQASREISNTLTEIGARALPILADALVFVSQNFETLLTAATAVGAVFAGGLAINAVVGLFANLGRVIAGARAAFIALNVVIRANPLGLLVTAIQVAIVALGALAASNTRVGEAIREGFQRAILFVQNLLSAFVQRVRATVEAIGRIFRSLGEGDLRGAAAAAGTAAGEAFQTNFVSLTAEAVAQTREQLRELQAQAQREAAQAARDRVASTLTRFEPGNVGGSTGGTGARTVQTVRTAPEIENALAALREELRISGLSNREREIAQRVERELNQLKQAGVVISEEQEASIRGAVAALVDQTAEIEASKRAQQRLNQARQQAVQRGNDAIAAIEQQTIELELQLRGEEAKIPLLRFQNQLKSAGLDLERGIGAELEANFRRAQQQNRAAQEALRVQEFRQGTDALQDQLRLVGLIGEEREREEFRIRTINDLKRAGIDLDGEGNQLLQERLAAFDALQAAEERARTNPALGIREALDASRQQFTDLRSQARELTTDLTNGLVDSIDQFVATGRGGFRSLLADFGAQLRRVGIQQVLGGVIGQFQNGIGGLFGGGTPGVAGPLGGRGGGPTPVVVTNGPGGLGGVGDNFVQEIQTDFQRTTQGFAQAAGTQGGGGFLGGLGGVFSTVLGGLGNVFNGLIGGVGNIFSSILGGFGGGGGLFGSLLGGIGGIFGFAQGGIMTARGAASLPRIPPIQAYQQGGIANSPQLALFGEGSRPEAFIPLPDGRSIPVTMDGGGGMNVTNQFNITTPDADSFRAAMPQILADAGRQTSRQAQRNN